MNLQRISGAAAAVAMLALALAACTADAPPGAVAGWPSSIAAIGHSGLTGYDSDAPQRDAPGNSWATGDNPEVDSVYLRILAENPAIEGNAVNAARDGSDVSDLPRQVDLIVAADPQPQLVIVQSIDNDIRCDGTDAENLPAYRDALTGVLDRLTEGAPDAEILFVSQWGTVAAYADLAMARDPRMLAGTGPCDLVDPATNQLVPENVEGLQAIVDAYFAVVVDVCASYENCLTDDGAMQTMALDDADVSPDGNHLTVAGHAKMAAIAWDVLYGDR